MKPTPPHPGSIQAGDTWLEPEELCYPNGGMTRRCRARNVMTGKLRTVRCGIPDTYFSIPAAGGWIGTDSNGEFEFNPSMTTEQPKEDL